MTSPSPQEPTSRDVGDPSTAGMGGADFTWPSCGHASRGVCYQCYVERGQRLAVVERDRDDLWYAASAILRAKDLVTAACRLGAGDTVSGLLLELTAADESMRTIVAKITPAYPAKGPSRD